jgi:hypothetical protein
MKWYTNSDGTLSAKWCGAVENYPTFSEDRIMAREYQTDAREIPSFSPNSSMLEAAPMPVDQANVGATSRVRAA